MTSEWARWRLTQHTQWASYSENVSNWWRHHGWFLFQEYQAQKSFAGTPSNFQYHVNILSMITRAVNVLFVGPYDKTSMLILYAIRYLNCYNSNTLFFIMRLVPTTIKTFISLSHPTKLIGEDMACKWIIPELTCIQNGQAITSIIKCGKKLSVHYQNVNGRAFDVEEWISYFTPHITGHVITYACWDWSYSMLVERSFALKHLEIWWRLYTTYGLVAVWFWPW